MKITKLITITIFIILHFRYEQKLVDLEAQAKEKTEQYRKEKEQFDQELSKARAAGQEVGREVKVLKDEIALIEDETRAAKEEYEQKQLDLHNKQARHQHNVNDHKKLTSQRDDQLPIIKEAAERCQVLNSEIAALRPQIEEHDRKNRRMKAALEQQAEREHQMGQFDKARKKGELTGVIGRVSEL